MQYRVGRVHPTGLTVARGVRRCPQGGYNGSNERGVDLVVVMKNPSLKPIGI
jgi:hypothetical protein